MVATGSTGWPEQALANAVYEFLIGVREVVDKTIYSLNKDAPLRQAGHRAHSREPCLDRLGHSHAELRVIFDFLAFFRASRRSAHAPRCILLSCRVAHMHRISKRDSMGRPR